MLLHKRFYIGFLLSGALLLLLGTIPAVAQDTTPPTVTSVTADGTTLADGSTINFSPLQFTVTFSEDVQSTVPPLEYFEELFLMVDSNPADGDDTIGTSNCDSIDGTDTFVDWATTDTVTGNTVVFTPTTPFAVRNYKLFVCGGANGGFGHVEDLAGNALDGTGNGTAGDDYVLNFTISAPADSTPPSIESITTTTNGALNSGDVIDPNAVFQIDFSERVFPEDKSEFSSEVFILSAGPNGTIDSSFSCNNRSTLGTDDEIISEEYAYDYATDTVSVSSGSGTFPFNDYELHICGSPSAAFRFQDFAGNDLGSNTVISFTVGTGGPVDTTPPTVSGVTAGGSPLADGDVRANSVSQFAVTFSENVTSSDGTAFDLDNEFFFLSPGGDGVIDAATCADDISNDTLINSGTINYSSNTATINLSPQLTQGQYRFFICGQSSTSTSTGFIEDLSGNALDGNADGTGGDDYVLDFTINNPPTANDDTASTDEDTLTANLHGTLIGNDNDPDSDPLNITAVDTTGTTGTVTFDDAADSVIYDPNGQFEGLDVGDTATDTFTYTVSDGNGGTAIATVTVTINGVRDIPTVEFSAGTYNVNEGDGTATITVTRSGVNLAFTSDATVSITGGTATGGTDYDASGFPATVTFNANETTANVTIPITQDNVDEGASEDITFNLAAGTDATLGVQTTTTLTIADDDTADVSISGGTVVEGAGPLPFTIMLSNPIDRDISIQFDTSDNTATAGSDYTAITGQIINIPANTTTVTTGISITDDTLVELDETVTGTLSNLVANGSSATLATASADGTITDNDSAEVSISGATTAEDASPLSFTLTLTSEVDAPVTVEFDTMNDTATAGSDYTAITGQTVTIPANTTTADVDVIVTDDTLVEADETLTGRISNVAAGGRNVSLGATTDATGTITDDDAAEVSINGGSVAENAGSLSFTISLTNAVDVPITVQFDTVDSSAMSPEDYTAITGQIVTIPANALTVDVDVTINDDLVEEPDEVLLGTLSNLNPNGRNANIVADPTATGTITNDDIAGVTLSTDALSVSEGGTAASLDVSLETEPQADVDVTLTFATGAPDGATASTLTQTISANGVGPVTFDVSAIDDAIAEGAHTDTLTVTVSSADLNYDNGASAVYSGGSGANNNEVTVNITDDDTAGVTLSTDTLGVSEDGTTDTLSISLDTEPTADVDVTVTLTTGAPNGATVTTVIPQTITAGNTGPVTFDVAALDDGVAEGAHTDTLTVTVSSADDNYNDAGSAVYNGGSGVNNNDVTVNITDNDTAGVTLSADTLAVTEGSTAESLTVSLNTEPTANVDVMVTLATGAPNGATVTTTTTQTITAGNTGPVTFDVAALDDAIPEGAHTDTLTVTVSSGDPNYNDAGSAVYSGGGGANNNEVTINITDNDQAVLIGTGMVSVSEGGGTVPLDISLSTAPTENVTITATLAAGAPEGAEITLSSDVIAAGDTGPVTLGIGAIDDLRVEGAHSDTVTITVSSADTDYDDANATYNGGSGANNNEVAVDIADNDAVGVTISKDTLSLSESGMQDTFTVTLDSLPVEDVTVNLSYSSGGTDGARTVNTTPASVVIPADEVGPVRFTIGARDDTTVEGPHTDDITVTVTSADPNYNDADSAVYSGGSGADNNIVTAQIVDNDSPGIAIEQSFGSTEISEAGLTDAFTVVLTQRPTDDVIMTFTPDAQCEFDTGSGFAGAGTAQTLTFTPVNWNRTQTVTVRAIDDTAPEANPHPCVLDVISPSSSDTNYDGTGVPVTLDGATFTTPGSFNAQVTDNDNPGLSFSAATVREGGSTTYTLSLNTAPTNEVSIDISTDSQCNITGALPVTVAAGDQGPVTITVEGVRDGIAEGEHLCALTHTTTSTDGAYDGLTANHNISVRDPRPPANDGGDDGNADPSPTATTVPSDVSNWRITITADPTLVTAGDAVTFTIVVEKLQGGTPITMRFPILDTFTVQSATSDRGNVRVDRQTVIYQDDINAGEAGTITVDTLVDAIDGATTFKSCIISPVSLCDTVTLNTVTELPETGETPRIAPIVLVLLSMITLIVSGAFGVLFTRNRR